ERQHHGKREKHDTTSERAQRRGGETRAPSRRPVPDLHGSTITRDHLVWHRAFSLPFRRRQASAAATSPRARSHSAGHVSLWVAMSSLTLTIASRPAIPTKLKATGPRPRLIRRRPSGEV